MRKNVADSDNSIKFTYDEFYLMKLFFIGFDSNTYYT